MNDCRRGIEAFRRQARARWADSALRRGLQAWISELIGLLPPRLAAQLDRQGQTRWLHWPLAATEVDARPAILLLPAPHAMVQRITLPAAAVRHLNRVLRYELDRYFPFAPDELHMVARVLRKDGDSAQVQVVAVAQERLDAIVTACHERGVRLKAIDVLDADGERLGVDLLPAGAGARASSAVRLDRWLGVACLVLAVGLAATFLYREQQRLESMQTTVADQREQVQRLQTMRQQLEATVGASRYLSERKASRATLSELLAELTTCLGEEDWVSELSLENGSDITFSGQSSRASALIARVRECPNLEQVRFQGVIQSDDSTGQERYSLRASLRERDPTLKEGANASADES
ncbi:type II secretion system protein GspL [Salinicola aestuarinus]|uniref:type II secretion system protein GspL n=1 Tax=Salinicola aestuarinus TaxID=1949082 RepID=UPI00130017AF|nr:type II secretion system protein GspL [Salinicola aestuarinus]